MFNTFKTLITGFALATIVLGSVLTADVAAPLGSDSRSTTGGGVIGTQNWGTGGDGFKISWDITQVGSNFHYIYSITDATGGALSKDMSHFILQLSNNITGQNFASNIFNVSGATITDGPRTFSPSDPGSSNPGLPGDIYGIKFETFDSASSPSFSFDSTRAPVWGDFYTKDGKTGQQDVYAYNAAFGTSPDGNTTDFNGWIARPDTTVAVPEPSTWLLLGSTLGFVIIGKRYRTKSV